MPATIIDITTAGPACFPAACPVSTKIPVPMIAPTPSSVSADTPNVRFSVPPRLYPPPPPVSSPAVLS